MLQVNLRLERVIDAVVALLEKLLVAHLAVVAVVLQPGGLHQPVRHQRPGGNNRVDHPGVDQVADDQPHLAHGQRPGKGHHYEAVLVARHGFQHVGGVAHLASGVGRLPHGADQVVHRLDLREVERLHRRQLVLHRVVQRPLAGKYFTLFLVGHKEFLSGGIEAASIAIVPLLFILSAVL